MRSYLLFLSIALSAVTYSSQQRNRYDNFNADSIIQNERILLAYYKCVMDKGPCTKDGKNFKLQSETPTPSSNTPPEEESTDSSLMDDEGLPKPRKRRLHLSFGKKNKTPA